MTYKVLSLAIAAALLTPSQYTFAQGVTLEEVIVTARKREEAVQDTPISVTAVLAEDLEKRGVSEFTQLAYNNPNVKIAEGAAGAGVATTVAIRGNVQNDTTFQLDPAVGTYIDNMIVSRTFALTGSMVDLESVQTLKGPQGTLFGRNTTGGALVITTKNPEFADLASGYVKAEAGELSTLGFTAALNLPLGDTIAVRLVGSHTERDGYMHLSDGRDFGDQEMDMFRAKILWNISDDTTLLLSGEHVEMDATSTVNVATQPNHPQLDDVSPIAGVYTLGPGFSVTTPLIASDEKNSADVETINANLTHETGWGEVKLLAGQRKLDVGINLTLPPGLGYTKQDKPDNEQLSVELQLNGSFLDDRLDLTSGLYYFDETTHEDQLTNAYPVLVPLGFPVTLSQSKMETNVKSKSLYVQSTYHLTEDTNFTLGLRETADDRKSTGSYNLAPLTWDDDITKFNYLVSLDHKFTPDIMGYANTSTGYRSSGANITPNANRPGEWNSFSPESLTNYEVGLKSDWLDGRLRANAAFFFQDYEDYQYTKIELISVGNTPPAPTRVANTSDAEIKGAELEITALLPFDVTASLSYGYVDGKETAGDNRLSNIPQNTWGLGLTKRFSQELGDIDLTANYDWRDSFYTQLGAEQQSHVDERGLLNLSASLTSGNWQVVGYVNNVTDERYYNHITYSPGNAVGLTGLSFSSIGLPRVAGAKLTFNF
ncbi:MAG: TonB-dependent receptor [Spongiibacteraceae bacterium]